MGLCRSFRMRTKLSAAYEFTRSVWFSHGKIPELPVLKRLRHPWVCAAVSGCGASSPPPLNSRVPCDSAMTKAPHCQYSYACLKGLAPPMGLCRSLRMRRELYEFTRSV